MSEKRDFISWARNPPVHGLRGPWETAIMDCVEMGDERFSPILAMHFEQGVIDCDRARGLLTPDAKHAAA